MSIIVLTKENYASFIAESKVPVLVGFTAPWCTYCKRLAPAFAEIAEQTKGSFVIAKVDIDDSPELQESEHIELVPTLKLYNEGNFLGSIVAPESKATVDAFIADALGRKTSPPEDFGRMYDVVVVGGGPAGYSAALYAARAGLSTLVLEKLSAGGQIALTEQIDNYPGFDEGIGGFELGERMKKGAERFGVKSRIAEVTSMRLADKVKKIETSEGIIHAGTVVLAMGASPRELGLPNESALVGKGVNYCAACDGMFFKDKIVAVIGGGNSAVADALHLSRIAKEVILIHRRDTLRAEKVYNDPLLKAENVEFIWDSAVTELIAGEKLTGLRLKNLKTNKESTLDIDGVFVSIGRKPATEVLADQITLDNAGYIVADETTLTNIPGVFAAGDIRTKALRQVVTAVADGAVAVHYAQEYIAKTW